MKVLVITPRVPYPPKDGGAIAMFNMSKGLVENGVDVDLFSYNTSKHYVSNPSEIEELSFSNKIHTSDIDNNLKPIEALKNLFQKRSYNTSRFIQPSFEKDLISCLSENSFDVIQCEVLFGALYVDVLRKYAPKSKLVYRAHNVEYKIWERLSEQASGLKKVYLRLMSSRLKGEEESLIKKFDLVVPISEVDKEWFLAQGVKNIFVSPTGVNHFDVFSKESSYKIGFLGSLDWQPNVEGVAWFVENVWSLVVAKLPAAEFEIAGRNCPDDFSKYNEIKGIKVIGEVTDAVEFIKSNTLMVVPLMSGSGMRIKIVEGLALSVPMVSTSIGCEGIAVSDGKEILVADKPLDFAEKIIALCSDELLQENIAKKGYEFVLKNYSNKALVKSLTEHYEKIINA